MHLMKTIVTSNTYNKQQYSGTEEKKVIESLLSVWSRRNDVTGDLTVTSTWKLQGTVQYKTKEEINEKKKNLKRSHGNRAKM